MSNIAIEVSDDDVTREIQAVVEAPSVRGKAFDGSMEVTTLLVALTPVVIKQIASILKVALERNKHVRVIHNGTEIRGVSESTLLKILDSNKAADGQR